MNDAEAQFAARLADELGLVLGPEIEIDAVELETGSTGRGARARATLRAGGRVETIEVVGTDVLGLYGPLVRRAAETRLRDAFVRVVKER